MIQRHTGDNIGSIIAVWLTFAKRLPPRSLEDRYSITHTSTVPFADFWEEIYTTDRDRGLSDAAEDSAHGRFHTLSTSFQIPKVTAERLQKLGYYDNCQVVALVEDTNGETWLSGSKEWPLTLTYTATTGENYPDFNRTTVQLTARSILPITHYIYNEVEAVGDFSPNDFSPNDFNTGA